MNEYWSWILTFAGVTGFVLAGKKIWWCWYINIACQALWVTYAVVTEQWGFIVASVVYTVVFTKNAIAWTKEHRWKKNFKIDYNEVTWLEESDISFKDCTFETGLENKESRESPGL
jgi:hypothetical protein